MNKFIGFMMVAFIWVFMYMLFSGFVYIMMWAFSYQDNFSWKLSFGILLAWLLVVRLFRLASGRPL